MPDQQKPKTKKDIEKAAKDKLRLKHTAEISFLHDDKGVLRVVRCSLYRRSKAEVNPRKNVSESLAAIGYAICSLKKDEVPLRSKGAAIAVGRALDAIHHRKNIAPVSPTWHGANAILSLRRGQDRLLDNFATFLLNVSDDNKQLFTFFKGNYFPKKKGSLNAK